MRSLLPTEMARADFCDWLQEQVPENPGVGYLREGPVPCCMKGQEDAAEVFFLQIWKFSFAESSSLREPPLLDTSYRLWQRFEKEGFLTSADVLYVFFQDFWLLGLLQRWFQPVCDSGNLPLGRLFGRWNHASQVWAK